MKIKWWHIMWMGLGLIIWVCFIISMVPKKAHADYIMSDNDYNAMCSEISTAETKFNNNLISSLYKIHNNFSRIYNSQHSFNNFK